MTLPGTPGSPYVTLRMSRKQAEWTIKALRVMARGKAKSSPLHAVIRHFAIALNEEASS